MKETKFFVIPDCHIPFEDKRAVKCALKIMEWFAPDQTIILGDFVDCAPVNRHERANLQFREGKRLKQDFDLANNLLDAIQARSPKVTFLQGNHEMWVDRLIGELPELDGLVNVEVMLRLEERGIKYLPYNVPYKLGKLHFIHGLFTGQHHAQKHVDAFGRSIVYGHLHDVQMHIKVSPMDVRDKHVGLSIGCLADKNPQYMKNRPNNWTHCVATGTVRADGSFTIEPLIITDGVVSVAGKNIRWDK